jgi:hypothetical protein
MPTKVPTIHCPYRHSGPPAYLSSQHWNVGKMNRSYHSIISFLAAGLLAWMQLVHKENLKIVAIATDVANVTDVTDVIAIT